MSQASLPFNMFNNLALKSEYQGLDKLQIDIVTSSHISKIGPSQLSSSAYSPSLQDTLHVPSIR